MIPLKSDDKDMEYDKKLDRITESLIAIEIALARQDESFKSLTRRTMVVEDQMHYLETTMESLKSVAAQVQGAVKLISAIGVLLTIGISIVSLYNILSGNL